MKITTNITVQINENKKFDLTRIEAEELYRLLGTELNKVNAVTSNLYWNLY